MSDPRRNSEWYLDPTAHEAIAAVTKIHEESQRRMKSLVYAVKVIIDLAGFELINRIELKDKKTGDEYK